MKKNSLGWLISMFWATHASIFHAGGEGMNLLSNFYRNVYIWMFWTPQVIFFHMLVEMSWIDYQLVSLQQSSFVTACVRVIPTFQGNGQILTLRILVVNLNRRDLALRLTTGVHSLCYWCVRGLTGPDWTVCVALRHECMWSYATSGWDCMCLYSTIVCELCVRSYTTSVT
jgi:hypothetical protein